MIEMGTRVNLIVCGRDLLFVNIVKPSQQNPRSLHFWSPRTTLWRASRILVIWAYGSAAGVLRVNS